MLESRAAAYATLAALGLVVGIALSEPAAAALGAAFLLPLIHALATPRTELPGATTRLSAGRLLEGDSLEVEVELEALEALPWLEVELEVPARSTLADGAGSRVLALSPGENRTLSYRFELPRWGVYPIGALTLRGVESLAMREVAAERPAEAHVLVYPRLERLRRLVAPLATRPASGNRPAAVGGEGIEFSEIRAFRAGERVRRINWRASARRGELLVSDRAPERSSDVILFLDSLVHAERADASTLDHAVRAAGTLAQAYLRGRDRVGLLTFGKELEWVLAGSGPRQLYKIADAVLSSESARLYRWRDPRSIPPRVLPPQALVVALTPLLDWRVIHALLDLRGRGFDLVLIEVDPLPLIDRASAASQIGYRVWLLERELVRSRFLRAGVPLVRFDATTPLAHAVEELASAR
jgi:uncharacterized protein (DUF58 family)